MENPAATRPRSSLDDLLLGLRRNQRGRVASRCGHHRRDSGRSKLGDLLLPAERRAHPCRRSLERHGRLSIQLVANGAPVAGTTTNAAVLKPAPGVIDGFVAVAPGVATLSDASGATSLVTVVAATGTAGVRAGRRPLSDAIGVMPRRLTA